MNLIYAAWHLNNILRDHPIALETLSKRIPYSIFSIYWQLHLPLLLLFPIAGLLSFNHCFTQSSPFPVGLWQQNFSWRDVWLPTVIIHSLLLLAVVYDRIVENAQPKLNVKSDLTMNNKQPVRNIALYFHLPTCGVSAFFSNT